MWKNNEIVLTNKYKYFAMVFIYQLCSFDL